MVTVTTFLDCERDLIGKGGQPLLERWRASDEVKKFTSGFEHKALYRLTLSHVLDVKRKVQDVESALGDVSPREAIREIDDSFPNYPISHMFHMYVENHGCVPTFAAFRDFFVHPDYRGLCYDDFVDLIENGLSGVYSEEECRRALRWRIGNAYCSSFREVYTLLWLREKAGIDVKYHLFADTQLQTDLWVDESIICLRVPSNYLDRKRKPEAWAHQFYITYVDIPHQGYGKLWVPKDKQLEKLANLLRNPLQRASVVIGEDGQSKTTIRLVSK